NFCHDTPGRSSSSSSQAVTLRSTSCLLRSRTAGLSLLLWLRKTSKLPVVGVLPVPRATPWVGGAARLPTPPPPSPHPPPPLSAGHTQTVQSTPAPPSAPSGRETAVRG